MTRNNLENETHNFTNRDTIVDIYNRNYLLIHKQPPNCNLFLNFHMKNDFSRNDFSLEESSHSLKSNLTLRPTDKI